MPGLNEMLAAESIRLDAHAADWRQAISLAGEALVEAGTSGASYTTAMIENVEKNGPYIVISPGFAFAHARADDSVTRTGMSLVRLAEPVAFGHEKNDPVRLVLALAAVDHDAHRAALGQLARLLADQDRRAALDRAGTAEEVLAVLGGTATGDAAAPTAAPTAASPAPVEQAEPAEGTGPAPTGEEPKNFVYTVCGNGLGTSLFLKNTLEQVLERWGWSKLVTVEATDTISARGRAHDADYILTSGEIARTLGDVGVPVEVIQDFTSQKEVDAALRRLYDL